MGHVIAFRSPPRRDADAVASDASTRAGDLVAFGRNDVATVIETICLLRESGRGDLLDAFNRGPALERRARRRASPGA